MAAQKYVCGFAFSEDLSQVLLIHKLTPEWQAGKLNGIGGKIECNEGKYSAMRREFKEECGIKTNECAWNLFFRLSNENFDCFFFWSVLDIEQARAMTPEHLEIVHVDELGLYQVVGNLNWLIPMALYRIKNPGEVARIW